MSADVVFAIRVILEFVGAFALILAFWIIGGGIIDAEITRARRRRAIHLTEEDHT